MDIYATVWMNAEDVMLSEISQPQKVKCCVSPLLRGSWRSQGQRQTEGAGCQERGGGDREGCLEWTELQFGKMKKSGSGWY